MSQTNEAAQNVCPKCGADADVPLEGNYGTYPRFECGSTKHQARRGKWIFQQTDHCRDRCRIAELTRDLAAARERINWLNVAEEERLKVYAKLDEEIQRYRTQLADRNRQIEQLTYERSELITDNGNLKRLLGSVASQPEDDRDRQIEGLKLEIRQAHEVVQIRDRQIDGLRELLKKSDPIHHPLAWDEKRPTIGCWQDAEINAALQQIAARRQEQEKKEGRG